MKLVVIIVHVHFLLYEYHLLFDKLHYVLNMMYFWMNLVFVDEYSDVFYHVLQNLNYDEHVMVLFFDDDDDDDDLLNVEYLDQIFED